MIKNSMSLKSKIKNIAIKEKVFPQAVLQTYMFERLLERISISKYKNNFILKGGILIASIIGIDSRTTMDMDTTIKGFTLNTENIKNIIEEIIEIKLEDSVLFRITNIESIREEDDYGGVRVHMQALTYGLIT